MPEPATNVWASRAAAAAVTAAGGASVTSSTSASVNGSRPVAQPQVTTGATSNSTINNNSNHKKEAQNPWGAASTSGAARGSGGGRDAGRDRDRGRGRRASTRPNMEHAGGSRNVWATSAANANAAAAAQTATAKTAVAAASSSAWPTLSGSSNGRGAAKNNVSHLSPTNGSTSTSTSTRGSRNSRTSKPRIQPVLLDASESDEDATSASGFAAFRAASKSADEPRQAAPLGSVWPLPGALASTSSAAAAAERAERSTASLENRANRQTAEAPLATRTAPAVVVEELPSSRQQLRLRLLGTLFAALCLKPDESLCTIDVHMLCQLLTLHGPAHTQPVGPPSRSTSQSVGPGASSGMLPVSKAEASCLQLLSQLFSLDSGAEKSFLTRTEFATLCRLVHWVNPALSARWVGQMFNQLLTSASTLDMPNQATGRAVQSIGVADGGKGSRGTEPQAERLGDSRQCEVFCHGIRDLVCREAKQALARWSRKGTGNAAYSASKTSSEGPSLFKNQTAEPPAKSTPRRIRPKLLSAADAVWAGLPETASALDAHETALPGPTQAELEKPRSDVYVRKALFQGAGAVGADDDDGSNDEIRTDDANNVTLKHAAVDNTAVAPQDSWFSMSAAISRWFASWTLSVLAPIVLAMGHACLANLRRILATDPIAQHALEGTRFLLAVERSAKQSHHNVLPSVRARSRSGSQVYANRGLSTRGTGVAHKTNTSRPIAAMDSSKHFNSQRQLRIKSNREKVRDSFAAIVRDFQHRSPLLEADAASPRSGPRRGTNTLRTQGTGHGHSTDSTARQSRPPRRSGKQTSHSLPSSSQQHAQPRRQSKGPPHRPYHAKDPRTPNFSSEFVRRARECLDNVYAVNYAWFAQFFVSELLRVTTEEGLLMGAGNDETPRGLTSGSSVNGVSDALLSRIGSKKLLSLEQRLTEPSEVRHDESDRLYEQLFRSRRGSVGSIARKPQRHSLSDGTAAPNSNAVGGDLFWRSSSNDARLLPHIVKHFLLSDPSESSVSIRAEPEALQHFFLFVTHADSEWLTRYVTAETVRQLVTISGASARCSRKPHSERSWEQRTAERATVRPEDELPRRSAPISAATYGGDQVNKRLMVQRIAVQLKQLRVLGKLLGLLTFSPYWATHDPEFASSDSIALKDTMQLIKAQVRHTQFPLNMASFLLRSSLNSGRQQAFSPAASNAPLLSETGDRFTSSDTAGRRSANGAGGELAGQRLLPHVSQSLYNQPRLGLLVAIPAAAEFLQMATLTMTVGEPVLPFSSCVEALQFQSASNTSTGSSVATGTGDGNTDGYATPANTEHHKTPLVDEPFNSDGATTLIFLQVLRSKLLHAATQDFGLLAESRNAVRGFGTRLRAQSFDDDPGMDSRRQFLAGNLALLAEVEELFIRLRIPPKFRKKQYFNNYPSSANDSGGQGTNGRASRQVSSAEHNSRRGGNFLARMQNDVEARMELPSSFLQRCVLPSQISRASVHLASITHILSLGKKALQNRSIKTAPAHSDQPDPRIGSAPVTSEPTTTLKLKPPSGSVDAKTPNSGSRRARRRPVPLDVGALCHDAAIGSGTIQQNGFNQRNEIRSLPEDVYVRDSGDVAQISDSDLATVHEHAAHASTASSFPLLREATFHDRSSLQATPQKPARPFSPPPTPGPSTTEWSGPGANELLSPPSLRRTFSSAMEPLLASPVPGQPVHTEDTSDDPLIVDHGINGGRGAASEEALAREQSLQDLEQRGAVLMARHPQLKDVVNVVGICIVSLGCEDICRQASQQAFEACGLQEAVEVCCRQASVRDSSTTTSRTKLRNAVLADTSVVAKIWDVQKQARKNAGDQIDQYCEEQTRKAVLALAPRSLQAEVVAAAADFACMKAALTARQAVEKHVREETERLFTEVVKDTRRLARPALQQRSLSHLSEIASDVFVSSCDVPGRTSPKGAMLHQAMVNVLDVWRTTALEVNGAARAFTFPLAGVEPKANSLSSVCFSCGAFLTKDQLSGCTSETSTLLDPFSYILAVCRQKHGCIAQSHPTISSCVQEPSQCGSAKVKVDLLLSVPSTACERVETSSIVLAVPAISSTNQLARPALPSDADNEVVAMTKFSVLHGFHTLVLREWLFFLLCAPNITKGRTSPTQSDSAASHQRTIKTETGRSDGDVQHELSSPPQRDMESLQTLFQRAHDIALFTALLPGKLREALPLLLIQKVLECCQRGGFSNGFLYLIRSQQHNKNPQSRRARDVATLLTQSSHFRIRLQVVLSTFVIHEIVSTSSLGSVFDNLVVAARSTTQPCNIDDIHQDIVRIQTVAVVVVSVMNVVVGLCPHFKLNPGAPKNLLCLFEVLCALRSMITKCDQGSQLTWLVKQEPQSLVVSLSAHIASVSHKDRRRDAGPLEANRPYGNEAPPMSQALDFLAHLD